MSENIEQVAWNLSQQIIYDISKLLQQASFSFTQGTLEKSFWKCREIRLLIFSHLSEAEREGLGKLEKGIMNETDRGSKSFLVSNYREKIMDLLGKYGYLVSKKQDYSKMF